MIRCESYAVPPLFVYATCERGVYMTAWIYEEVVCDHDSAPCVDCRELAQRLEHMTSEKVIAVSRANHEKRRNDCAAHPWLPHTTRCSVRA